ncbi:MULTISPECIES: helix-turn-helix domain-containing protein [unclassified Novosphingobium]|uniref:helix-turn-helix domain-containing protein n=1 Tax=unclassified Novosphingobium TaxID=2644732 RepID=UPI00135ACB80|nr:MULTISPECIES: helix-turn-helix domain-containing protein [unclassified Novosphingobium]
MASRAIIPLGKNKTPPANDFDGEGEDSAAGRGIPIRAISRAISVLQAINRAGSLNMMDIAQASQVPYPTACRIVQTLLHEGLIEREETRKHYRPTPLVRTLSQGFEGHGEIVHVARPHISALTREIGWPISLSTHVGSSMVLRDSTHALTSLCFNEYHPGYAMPILDCAAGLVHLAFCTEDARETVIGSLSRFGDDEIRHVLGVLREGALLDGIRTSGYAARGYNRFTLNPGKTSSIAVPILSGNQVHGCLTVAFFSTALEIREAVRELAPRLKACASDIASQLGSGPVG